jgi:hypothetical protein
MGNRHSQLSVCAQHFCYKTGFASTRWSRNNKQSTRFTGLAHDSTTPELDLAAITEGPESQQLYGL